MPRDLRECPLCGSDRQREAFRRSIRFDPGYPDYGVAQVNCVLREVFELDRIEQALRYCTTCGLFYRSPTYDEAELDRLYTRARMRDHYALVKSAAPSPAAEIGDPSAIWRRESRHSAFIHACITQHPSFSQSMNCVVDVGGQYGYNCRYFLGGDLAAYVQDPGAPPLLFPGVRHVALLDEIPWNMDVVICTHVLEHVVSLSEFVLEIAKRQAAGSLLYLEVPYELDSRLRNRDFGTPFHVNYFSGECLTNLLLLAGYAVDRVQTRRLTYGGSPILATFALAQRGDQTPSAARTLKPRSRVLNVVRGGLLRLANRYAPTWVSKW